jgi:hypothetical protein
MSGAMGERRQRAKGVTSWERGMRNAGASQSKQRAVGFAAIWLRARGGLLAAEGSCG